MFSIIRDYEHILREILIFLDTFKTFHRSKKKKKKIQYNDLGPPYVIHFEFVKNTSLLGEIFIGSPSPASGQIRSALSTASSPGDTVRVELLKPTTDGSYSQSDS